MKLLDKSNEIDVESYVVVIQPLLRAISLNLSQAEKVLVVFLKTG
jgi:hypothetical protein